MDSSLPEGQAHFVHQSVIGEDDSGHRQAVHAGGQTAYKTMTLASLQNVPQSEHDWLTFAFANQDHHNLLSSALKTQKGVVAPQTVLDPIAFFDFENWLRRHAQLHSVYDQTLNILTSDLTAVDINNKEQLTQFIFAHWSDHQQVAARLGVSQ